MAVPSDSEVASRPNPQDLMTELDVASKGKLGSQEMEVLTELDVQEAYKEGQPSDSKIEQPKHQSRRVNVSSGIKIDQSREYPDSEAPTEPKDDQKSDN
jgi:hypothetical protein